MLDRRRFTRALLALGAGSTLAPEARPAAIPAAPAVPAGAGGMALGLNADLGGARLLRDSEWYRDISALPVHRNSRRYLDLIGDFPYSQDAGGWTYRGRVIGLPYVVVDSATQPFVPVVCSQYLESCDLCWAPIPLRDDIVEGYPSNASYPATPSVTTDRHLMVIDRRARVIYELYKAYRRNDHWYCSNMAIWDMDDGDLQRPFRNTSVDVAGLSVLAGLLLGHQVRQSRIDHALRFTIPSQTPLLLSPPALHASGWGNENALPFGGRLRLKASVSEAAAPNGEPWRAEALHIVRALKRYGMINADTGLALSSQGDSDNWDFADGEGGPAWRQLRQLRTADFEVVDTGAKLFATNGPGVMGNAPKAELRLSAGEIRLGETVTLTPSWSGKALAWLTPVGHALRSPSAIEHRPTRDTWYQLEVASLHGRTRALKRVLVNGGERRYAQYDRYVAPHGARGNDGLTPSSPWPINVLSDDAYRHLVAGYVIGLLDGRYDLAGISRGEYDDPLLAVPSGAFGRPTVLQAVNRRQAVLHAGKAPRAALGSKYQRLSQIQLLGLRIETPNAEYGAYFSGDGAFLIDDCEFSGFRIAAVRMTQVSAALLRGNVAHNDGRAWLLRHESCSDIRLRGNVLDQPGRETNDYGGYNSGIVVD